MAKAFPGRLQICGGSGKRGLCLGNVFATVNTNGNLYQYATSLAAMASSFSLFSCHGVNT